MRLIDVDKIYPDCMTKDGKLAISQSQLADAPTIENITVFCENANEKTIEDLKVELERVKTELRPQGEWKDYSEDGYVECPICNCLTNCDDNIDELHYCWNCGAKLRKGGAE